MHPLAIALAGIGMQRGLELLRDGDATHLLYAAERCDPIGVIARDDDGDELSVQCRARERRKTVITTAA